MLEKRTPPILRLIIELLTIQVGASVIVDLVCNGHDNLHTALEVGYDLVIWNEEKDA